MNAHLSVGDEICIWNPMLKEFSAVPIPADGMVTFPGGRTPFCKQILSPYFACPPEKCPCGVGSVAGGAAGTVNNEVLIAASDPTGQPVGAGLAIAVFGGNFYVDDGAGNWIIQAGSNPALEIGTGAALPADNSTYNYFHLTSVAPTETYQWDLAGGVWFQIG